MTELAARLRTHPFTRDLHWPVAIVAITVAAGVLAGAGLGMAALLVALAGVAMVAGISDWKRSFYGLILYLPFAGLPVIALYPATGPPNLIKDVVFVIPAYLGFLAYMQSSRRPIAYAGAPVIAIVLLSTLVVLQAFNPSLPNTLVGLIGVKIWLLYIPMLFLGYHAIASKDELYKLLRWMSYAAVIPAAIGIFEAVLIYGGQAGRVFSWYGDAAAAVTQGEAFLQVDAAGTTYLRRVPSLFSSVTQYANFLTAMTAITYAWWRTDARRSFRRPLGATIWITVVLAAFLSGSRGAFFYVPLLVVAMLLLERGLRDFPLARLAAPALLVAAAAAIIGTSALPILSHAREVGSTEVGFVIVDGFKKSVETTWFGLGTGVDTIASRYAVSEDDLFQVVGGTWQESWYVKAVLELGIVSLFLIALLFGRLIRDGLRRHKAIRDPQLKVVSAAILAFLMVYVLAAFRSQSLDVDPVNVYFWLFAGVLAKIAVLDRAAAGDEPDVAGPEGKT